MEKTDIVIKIGDQRYYSLLIYWLATNGIDIRTNNEFLLKWAVHRQNEKLINYFKEMNTSAKETDPRIGKTELIFQKYISDILLDNN